MPAEQSVQLTVQNIGILFVTGVFVHASRILLQNRIPPWRKIVARGFLAGIVAVVAGILGINRAHLRFEEAWVFAVILGYFGVQVIVWLGPPLVEGLKVMVKGLTKGGEGGV